VYSHYPLKPTHQKYAQNKSYPKSHSLFSGAKSDFVSLLILSGVEWFWCCMVTVEPVVQWCDAHRDIVAKVHRYLSVFHR
ncbi:hypothetical protein QG034_10920, partial [Kingella kingae]|uniref:hypothetical protein n=1 Tax=Kingella kingae TaxID=504 RepID=UPI00254BC727